MKEMTKAKLEAAARLLCQRRGFMPEDKVWEAPYLGQVNYLYIHTKEIRAHYEVLLCIAEVMNKED